MSQKHHINEKPPTVLQLVGSVFSAMLGVQSEKNRKRDFKNGDAKSYIIIGIVVTLLLVAGLITIVSLVLP